ncbi:putative CRAL-TRIO lipid binding domain-containing protein [Helianthus anomalus]
MDYDGLSSFGIPVKTLRSCVVLLKNHYPERLRCLLVVWLPSVARVITQTIFQVLKPRTQQKLMIVREDYQEVLSKYFEELPPFLCGNCTCLRAFTSNPSNYTYIPLKNNFYINIFPLKTNTFSLSFSIK